MKEINNPFENLDLRLSNIENLLLDIKNDSTKEVIKYNADPEPYIYGIIGLAEFLKCSTPTAQKIKNSGKVPYSQNERTIIFEKEKVLNALSNTKKRKG